MSRFEGTVEEIVFRNDQNGWTVASFRLDGSGRTSAVGVMPFLSAGEHVILEGELTQHRDYGEQIKVASYEVSRPETKSGVEKYLGSGLLKGVGPATAKLIVAHFGTKTLDILESEPQRLREVPGIGKKRAAAIAEAFAMQHDMRATLIFLQGAGLTPTLAMKVYKSFGDQSEKMLKANPYRIADEIEGVGFQTADGIARGLGFLADNPDRLRSGVRYVLNESVNRMGHMYLPQDELIRASAELLGVDEDTAAMTVRELLIQKLLIADEIEGVRAIYLPQHEKAERETARLLIALREDRLGIRITESEADGEIVRYEAEARVRLSGEQRAAVRLAVTNGISIITGGPGTGKTTSINCILHILSKRGSVELCAPTGRAAKRMSEATGCEARTIHRLLEYGGEGEGFAKDEEDPIRADAIVVDEMSMVDVFLMRSLLRAVRPGTKLILVGDADQLPSVGAGNVLRDLIASERLPVAKLNEIFRQESESKIIVNAHRINHGEYPIIQNRDTDFFLERRDTVQAATESVVALVRDRLPKYLGVDCLRGIQVMTPMKKGGLGVLQLNTVLQEALNPESKEAAALTRGDTTFRKGDKVMQIRNDYEIEWTRGSIHGEGVFNGDIGFIMGVNRAERELEIEFDDGRRAVYDEGMLDEIELSYCISVHKSQGSEFDAVVLPLVAGTQMLMTRNLLYTAVTRAKRLVVIVGREECVRQMVDNNRILRRYSALAERIRRADEA